MELKKRRQTDKVCVHFLSASRTKQCPMRHVNSLLLIIAETELELNFSGGWPVDKHACVC